ncbi:MAG: hypothetical protein ACOY46_02065 [Bacillota bacterium]
MDKPGEDKKMVTKMRPDPDFKYLARRSSEIMNEGIPLSRNLKRDPGEIPGFYAEEHNE